ncbi:MAG: EscU/YscU/HrcU family type III secretion system export apparatus switch protein [Acidobacteria bacterium]|nr:EscU/YscU/HrcU family type III secretion system export apparatus switch protein [Acidobacteriota bacterium]
MADDRTEQPTHRRMRDARRKGQIARSKDVNEAVQLAFAVIGIAWLGPRLAIGLADAVKAGILRIGDAPLRTVDAGELMGLAATNAATLGLLVGPIALCTVVAAVAASTMQGGWNIASEALKLDFAKLNPANGLKRLVPSRAGIDLVKTLVVVTTIGWLTYRVVRSLVEGAPLLGRLDPARSAEYGWSEVMRLLRYTAVALGAFAFAEYGIAYWRHIQGLKMTKQEVKDDVKLSEGNPEIKGRVRRMQREQARKRMLASVPKATVVITNPTEYAVALEYSRDKYPAPRVIAKGKGLLAAKIREIARAHNVPIVENVPLAQSLYKGVEVGDLIPAELFGAVAEVLAYLIRLKQLVI